MFNSVRVTRLTTNLYTRRVHLVCCIFKVSHQLLFSPYYHLKGKSFKNRFAFFFKFFFLELMLSANKKENEKMHTIYFSKYLASKKSNLKTFFP